MVLKKASKKRRQSLRNSFPRKVLFFFSRYDNKRFPSKRGSTSMAPKQECFGSMYAPDFSMTGKSLLRFIFWADKTQSRRAPQTPIFRSRPVESAVRWNCAQLKQHSNDQRMTKLRHSHLPPGITGQWGWSQEWYGKFPSSHRDSQNRE